MNYNITKCGLIPVNPTLINIYFTQTHVFMLFSYDVFLLTVNKNTNIQTLILMNVQLKFES